MIKYITAVFKWVMRKETLSNALFAVRLASTLVKDKKSHERLLMAQKLINKAQVMTSNTDTKIVADSITASTNSRDWGDFEAKVVKDKHGEGNNGIDLSWGKNIGKIPLNVGWDPRDGSASFGIGPFRFGI